MAEGREHVVRGNGRKVYRVSELTRLIRTTLEGAFGEVWIEGEVSNFSQPASGHCYFTIKDDSAQIKAVLFRGAQRGIKTLPEDGRLVRVFGQLSVYERSGVYQVIVQSLEEAGEGALQAAFEALKKKLLEEGLFDEARKKPLPALPQHVGVVTSPTGAAIRDILKVVTRRFPNLHIVIAPVKVQGKGSAEEIAEAIALLNRIGGLDVIIAGRGGGSLEDLWSFNAEIVARAIAASGVPVISAVGHEIDYTISDFVADLRAATPSAAAEQVVGLKEDMEQHLRDSARGLARALKECLLTARNRLASASGSRVFAEPAHVARQYRQRVRELSVRVRHSARTMERETRQRLDDSGLRMSHHVRNTVSVHRQGLERLGAQLRALSPTAVLARGYSITYNDKGHVLRNTDSLRKGQRVKTRLSEGDFESEIQDIDK